MNAFFFAKRLLKKVLNAELKVIVTTRKKEIFPYLAPHVMKDKMDLND